MKHTNKKRKILISGLLIMMLSILQFGRVDAISISEGTGLGSVTIPDTEKVRSGNVTCVTSSTKMPGSDDYYLEVNVKSESGKTYKIKQVPDPSLSKDVDCQSRVNSVVSQLSSIIQDEGNLINTGDSGCGGVKTSIIDCDEIGGNGIIALLIKAINIGYAVAGILAVVAIMFAGVVYATAGDQEGRVKLAKDIIRNTVIGIMLYLFATIILNFLVPGGVFK